MCSAMRTLAPSAALAFALVVAWSPAAVAEAPPLEGLFESRATDPAFTAEPPRRFLTPPCVNAG